MPLAITPSVRSRGNSNKSTENQKGRKEKICEKKRASEHSGKERSRRDSKKPKTFKGCF